MQLAWLSVCGVQEQGWVLCHSCVGELCSGGYAGALCWVWAYAASACCPWQAEEVTRMVTVQAEEARRGMLQGIASTDILKLGGGGAATPTAGSVILGGGGGSFPSTPTRHGLQQQQEQRGSVSTLQSLEKQQRGSAEGGAARRSPSPGAGEGGHISWDAKVASSRAVLPKGVPRPSPLVVPHVHPVPHGGGRQAPGDALKAASPREVPLFSPSATTGAGAAAAHLPAMPPARPPASSMMTTMMTTTTMMMTTGTAAAVPPAMHHPAIRPPPASCLRGTRRPTSSPPMLASTLMIEQLRDLQAGGGGGSTPGGSLRGNSGDGGGGNIGGGGLVGSGQKRKAAAAGTTVSVPRAPLLLLESSLGLSTKVGSALASGWVMSHLTRSSLLPPSSLPWCPSPPPSAAPPSSLPWCLSLLLPPS